MAEKLEVLFDYEKDTKNTTRYQEDPQDGAPQVGTIYVQNWALKKLGSPKKIKVTIEAPSKEG